MQTSGLSILVHTIIFFGLITIFLIAIGVHIYTGQTKPHQSPPPGASFFFFYKRFFLLLSLSVHRYLDFLISSCLLVQFDWVEPLKLHGILSCSHWGRGPLCGWSALICFRSVIGVVLGISSASTDRISVVFAIYILLPCYVTSIKKAAASLLVLANLCTHSAISLTTTTTTLINFCLETRF